MGQQWTREGSTCREVGYSHPLMKALRVKNATYLAGGLEIAVEADKIWRILQDMGAPLARKTRERPLIESKTPSRGIVTIKADGTQTLSAYMRPGSALGRAYLAQGFIRLYGQCDWHTLAHELVHMALPFEVGHSRRFYDTLRTVIERRWKVTLDVSKAPARYGYAWDWHFRAQYLHLTEQCETPLLTTIVNDMRKVAAEKRVAKPRVGKPRSSAKAVEQWLEMNIGKRVRIRQVMDATGAAVNTVRKHIGTRLHPIDGERGLYVVGGYVKEQAA